MDQQLAKTYKKRLIELVRKHSYREGNFTLSSGKSSTFYIDIKNVSLLPEGADLIGKLTWTMLNPKDFCGVGGPTLGADPLATALSLSAYSLGTSLPAFIIRKEPKKHGTSQWIEGRENLRSNSELLVIEDVVTTGGSSIKAIEKVRAEGFTVKKLVSVLDRNEGGSETLQKMDIQLISLCTIDEIKKAG